VLGPTTYFANEGALYEVKTKTVKEKKKAKSETVKR